MSITTSLNNIKLSTKAITYHALVILVNDIQHIIKKHVELSTKHLLDDLNETISTHVHTYRQAFQMWLKVRTLLAWNIDGQYTRNYMLLSLILCLDPNADKSVLTLLKQALIYDQLVEQLTTFITKLNQRLIVPLTRDSRFQYVLSIQQN